MKFLRSLMTRWTLYLRVYWNISYLLLVFGNFIGLKTSLQAIYKPYTVSTRVVLHLRLNTRFTQVLAPLSCTCQCDNDARKNIFAVWSGLFCIHFRILDYISIWFIVSIMFIKQAPNCNLHRFLIIFSIKFAIQTPCRALKYAISFS